jgi:hypothetical protein
MNLYDELTGGWALLQVVGEGDVERGAFYY